MAAPPAQPSPPPSGPEWEEVSLADLLRTIHRRRALLVTFVLVGLLASVAFTVAQSPEYQSRASIVPLEQTDIIQNWLKSRQAAELALADLGTSADPAVTGATPEERATALARQVTVASSARGNERLITITAAMPDPILARDVAAAYLGTLSSLRPELENITRTETFVKFYDGSNAQEAQRRSEEVARQKVYWIVLDTPLIPQEASKPQPVLNVSLGLTLGLMLGVLGVFGAEWMGRFRAELSGSAELRLPGAPSGPPPGAPASGPKFQVVKGGRPGAPGAGNGQAAREEPVARFWRRR